MEHFLNNTFMLASRNTILLERKNPANPNPCVYPLAFIVFFSLFLMWKSFNWDRGKCENLSTRSINSFKTHIFIFNYTLYYTLHENSVFIVRLNQQIRWRSERKRSQVVIHRSSKVAQYKCLCRMIHLSTPERKTRHAIQQQNRCIVNTTAASTLIWLI